MLEKGVAKRWKIIKQTIQKGIEKLAKTGQRKNETNIEKKKQNENTRGGDVPLGAEDTKGQR